MKLTRGRTVLLVTCLLTFVLFLPGLVATPQAGDCAARLAKPVDSSGNGPGDNPAGSDAGLESVLIRVSRPYTPVIDAVRNAGGTVTRQYKYFGGLAARVPRAALPALEQLVGPGAITKDLRLPLPTPVDPSTIPGHRNLFPSGGALDIAYDAVEAIGPGDIAGLATADPDAYLVNNATTHVSTLHAAGYAGQGIVVAVIDSGIRPGFPHLTLDGSVIGCEDFLGDGMGCSNFANDGHGTFVAGMISANVTFTFGATNTLLKAVQRYLPSAVVPTNKIPMIGSAPLSSIYALRVCTANGCPTSAILAAMDRAIELRDLYETGSPGGVKIQVANMSQGGPTLFAGRDIMDRAADAMLAHDIVVTSSAGNAGPSGMTSGHTASSLSTIAVGAASHPAYERIVRDLQYGAGIGAYYRPSNHIQTAYFSSRGPHADGRRAPDVTSFGDWNYGQGFASTVNGISLASGTSFSAPNVAGIAAVLRQAFPTATARQIFNAIVSSANPILLGDGSLAEDQGTGFVDATAARDLLAAGTVPDALPAPPLYVKSVKNNVEVNAGLPVLNGTVQQSIGPLKPGQRGEIIYEMTPNTAQVILTVSSFSASLPPEQQNIFFGDDLFFTVAKAKTSRQPGTTGYFFQTYTTGGQWVIDRPEFGLLRVTLNGDWTNAGDVSADVSIVPVADPIPQITAQGKILDGEVLLHSVTVPAGASSAEFRLWWREGWSHYPTNDVDMVLVDPDGVANYAGATLSDPELVTFASPKPGVWQVYIFGSTVNSGEDKYELRVSADGNVLH